MRSLGRCICALAVMIVGCDYDWEVQPKGSSSSSSGTSSKPLDCKSNDDCDRNSYCTWADGLCGTGDVVGACAAMPDVSSCPGKGVVCGCGLPTEKGDACALASKRIDIGFCK